MSCSLSLVDSVLNSHRAMSGGVRRLQCESRGIRTVGQGTVYGYRKTMPAIRQEEGVQDDEDHRSKVGVRAKKDDDYSLKAAVEVSSTRT